MGGAAAVSRDIGATCFIGVAAFYQESVVPRL